MQVMDFITRDTTLQSVDVHYHLAATITINALYVAVNTNQVKMTTSLQDIESHKQYVAATYRENSRLVNRHCGC